MSTGTGMTVTPDIGLACSTDANCQAKDPALTCLLPTQDSKALGGGPPNGYCTKACTGDADCPNGATCLTNMNNEGECFLDCMIGPELMFVDDEIPASKCHARQDTRCTPLQSGATVCLPVCGKDTECGGRVCDPRTGYCMDTANQGKPAGVLCDEMAMNEDGCAGYCQPFVDNFAICTSPCSLGGQPIEQQNDCNGIQNGLCLFSPTGHGAGDWGVCTPNCSAHDRCYNPQFWCRSTSYAPNMPAQTGYCIGAQECPNGQSDCANLQPPQIMDFQWTCTTTPVGDYCLETDTTNGDQLVFPLTSMGTGGAGGTGGGTTVGAGAGGTGGVGGN